LFPLERLRLRFSLVDCWQFSEFNLSAIKSSSQIQV
jgi:hypothetical protein